MPHTESILEEYRRATFDERLNLFLECPSLRTRFMEIDQNEMAAERSRGTSAKADTEVKGSKYSDKKRLPIINDIHSYCSEFRNSSQVAHGLATTINEISALSLNFTLDILVRIRKYLRLT